MKLLLSIAIVMSAVSAQADIIKCVFTEPFVSFEYSMTQSALEVTDATKLLPTTQKNVSFQIMGPGHFELWDKNKNVIAVLVLNYSGSDGMSDNVFPYEVEYTTEEYGRLVGGCTSNFQPLVVEAE